MSEWKELKIEDFCEVIGGGTPSTKEDSYYGGEISWITPRDLTNYKKRFILRGERNITELGLKNSSARILPKNSILLTSRAPIGYLAIAEKEVCTNQGFKSLVINPEKADYNFVYYLIKSNVERIKGLGTGTTFAEISGSVVKNLKFSLPDLPTQTAIAEILSSLDDKIELNNKINQELETLAQTLFKQWFIDFEFPNENGEPYKSSCGEMMVSELGEIPKGWEVNKLSKVTIISSSKRIFSEEYVNEGIPFFRGKEITELDKSNKISSELFISEERYNEIKSKFGSPKIGDILITSVGTIGNTYLVNDDFNFYFKDGNITWIKDYISYLSPYYIFTWLRSKNTQNYIKEVCIGSTQQALTISALNNLNIVLPDELTESKFTLIANDIYTSISKNKNENQELTNLRDTLLTKLISGELEINEINN